MAEISIPKTQTAALVPKQGGPVEFDDNYPVSMPGQDEILVKVLYTGVCQSGKLATSQSFTLTAYCPSYEPSPVSLEKCSFSRMCLPSAL